MENLVYFSEEVNPVLSLFALVGRVLVNTCKKSWNSPKQPLDVKLMDVPGSSLAPCFYPQKASDNYLRLCQFITIICGDLFRDILSRYIKPADLRSELDNNKQKLVNIFNKQQQNLIYPDTGNTSLTANDFDISILYILLRNICNIPSHRAGWGNRPAKGDKSIAAGIEIIRLTRNLILAHSTSGMVEDPVFETQWKELRNAVVQIETQLTGSDLYKRGVDFLHSCNLTSFGTKACHNEEKSKQEREKMENLVYFAENVNPVFSLVALVGRVLVNTCKKYWNSAKQPLDGVEITYDKRSARFAEFFDELAEGMPEEKIARLKDYIQNNSKAEDIASIKQAVSARDCLRYLRDAKRFTSSDVMFVQYLFKKIDCGEQYEECYKYAEKQDALCFYEKPPADGYKNVLFHVKGNLSDYSSRKIDKIRENLAALLNCTSKEILIGGACPLASFLLVLSIKEVYLCKLISLEQCDKDKLSKLDIDYYIVDLTVINLEPSYKFGWNIYFDPEHVNRKKYEIEHSLEEKSTVSSLQHMTTVLKEKDSSSNEDSEDSNSNLFSVNDFGNESNMSYCKFVPTMRELIIYLISLNMTVSLFNVFLQIETEEIEDGQHGLCALDRDVLGGRGQDLMKKVSRLIFELENLELNLKKYNKLCQGCSNNEDASSKFLRYTQRNRSSYTQKYRSSDTDSGISVGEPF